MRTMPVHVIQLEVKVFSLALNVFWLNWRTDTTDFHMNYRYNVPKDASACIVFGQNWTSELEFWLTFHCHTELNILYFVLALGTSESWRCVWDLQSRVRDFAWELWGVAATDKFRHWQKWSVSSKIILKLFSAVSAFLQCQRGTMFR